MAQKIYALLVGINDYAPEVGRLAGCLNDVDHFNEYLTGNFNKSELAIEVLKDRDATRGNIIKQFRKHLGKAKAGDVAVFQYCGHGARWKSAAAFKEFYPDGKDEGLVCYDSRGPGGYDLADKELAVLLAELAKKDAHVAVLLDCCHSGSGTRNVNAFKGLKARLTHEVSKERPLESYVDGYYAERQKKKERLAIPASKHILLAACERTQLAQETVNSSGVFTDTLLEVLSKSGGGNISYADLFVRCRAAVRTRAEDQSPQFEPYENFDAYAGFLGRAASGAAHRHRVYFEVDSQAWKIDAGAVAPVPGIPTDSTKVVKVALYRGDDAASFAGNAAIVKVGPQTSVLQPDFQAETAMQYRAEITKMPAAPTFVYLEGEAKGTEILKKALTPEIGAALGVELTDIPEGTRYALAAEGGKFVLKQRETNVKILGVKDYSEQSAKTIFYESLKPVVQWERILALQNHHSEMNKDEIDFVFTETPENGKPHQYEQDEMTLDYVKSGKEWKKIRGKIQIRNRTRQPLHFLVLYFSSKYGIFKIKNDPMPQGEEYVTVWGDQPDHYFDLDDTMIEGQEYKVKEEINNLKLIVSTEKIDDFLLAQKNVKNFGEDLPATRGMGGVGEEDQAKMYQDEWFAKKLCIKVVRQLDQVGAKDTALAKGKIVVKGHPSVKANLSLNAATTGTRGAGQGFDFYKAFEHHGLQMLNFSAGTRGDSENILELTDIQNAEALAQNPLEIEVNVPLNADEGILPFVFDGQHVMLGGDAYKDEQGNTHISIDHIPETPDNRRSVGKALKLYFFKTYLKQDNVNQLCWVEFKEGGAIVRHKSMIAEKVNAAQNIVVLIHGIIGDSENIAKGMYAAGLDKKFDLVLTYDYENLSTPIAETALDLKKKLEAAGFGATDNKKLTLLAHSMGGLVSRWFIEREGGNSMIDHLVMCGTPNNGSPFGKIDSARKILNVLTGVAMNYIPALIPFNGAILFALNRSKKITPTLEQMNPASEFMTALNSSSDPGVRYTILAGDVESYQEPSDQFFAKMLAKTGKGIVFDALFGSGSHDIAVGVESILGIDGSRNPMPKRENVACHHLNYFISEAGQKALAGVEW